MRDPSWWAPFRRIVTFLLGCAVILDSLVEKNTATVGKLVVGLILVGVLPLEDFIRLAGRNGRRKRAEESEMTDDTNPPSDR